MRALVVWIVDNDAAEVHDATADEASIRNGMPRLRPMCFMRDRLHCCAAACTKKKIVITCPTT
jgi:hypothetical protein